MRPFDLYEFAGIIVPGTVLLAGACLCSPAFNTIIFDQDLSVGKTAISLVLAYGLGHLVAALGNMIEKAWWRSWRGWPSDWPRTRNHHLLAEEQLRQLESTLSNKLDLRYAQGLKEIAASDWFAVVRQIYAKIAECGAAQRVDIFNSNYALNRGLAAALLVILVIVVITHGFAPWQEELLLALGAIVAVYRMHRFGVHYARELFVQFLTLEIKGRDAPTESKG